jgi:hypothetical protein
MKKSLPLLAAFLTFSVLFSGCGKDQYLYYNTVPQTSNSLYQIKELSGANAVDVVWLIDNSGSLQDYQNQVIQNAGLFMNDFITQGLDWKMGLISTDDSDAPYIGFAGSGKLDSTTADPVGTFTAAVRRLGTNGSGTEMTFIPFLKALRNDRNFERPNTAIAFIVVTDAPEQSTITAQQFITQLAALTGTTRNTYFYGAFASHDLNCASQEGAWDFAGSPYETFAKSTKGYKVFPLCQNFGPALATIGHDIVTRVSHPTIYLNLRPNVTTLHVKYHGVDLPAGEASQGGIWKYDYSLNAIVFNSLSFSTADSDAVQIVFDEDTGV